MLPSLSKQVVLVSAIMRTITQVLNSKAAEDKPIIAIQTREKLLENQTILKQDTEEPDIFEDVKLEAVVDGDKANTLNILRFAQRNKVNNLTSIRQSKT